MLLYVMHTFHTWTAGLHCITVLRLWAQGLVCLQTQRLRFDFNLPRGMSGKEVRQVEDLVNSWIQQDHGLATHVVPLQEAKDKGG